ncbi:copper homeostasis protein CutC [Kineosporia succinea]|uniref:PF03932 family protein CutC n=1 Tax=Kineosporia succinea TaxID=84632 RepID=A0ABT9P7H6_9ACTN|nr:copper homeostasis protein CutC [Kineosporia succinea]MDP9828648.1 copper homeostasis protein [Kineosporia succinea]
MTLLEICIEDAVGAAVAEAAGADRVELCSALSEGGLTPSVGAVRHALASTSRIGVQVLIRPRGGDFVFGPAEVAVMLEDASELVGLSPRLGFVVGCLTPDGRVDIEVLERLLGVVGDRPVTFHRAFDATVSLGESLDVLAGLGVSRVLTSGGAAAADAGALRSLAERAAGRISVMAGGGVRPANVAGLVAASGVGEVHCRASATVRSASVFGNPALPYDEGTRRVTSRSAVEEMVAALRRPATPS